MICCLGYNGDPMTWRFDPFPTLSRVTRAKVIAVAMMLVVPALGLVAGYYLEREGLLPTVLNRQRSDLTVTAPMLGPPVRNHLDPAYTDADADLIADPPATPAQQRDPEQLVLTIPTSMSIEGASAAWKPLLDHLSAKTSKPVVLNFGGETDTARLQSMKRGEAHLAVVTAGSVPLAVDAAGFVPVCMLPGDDSRGFTRMVFVVPADSPIQNARELRNTTVMFIDRNSNTGFKAAVVALREDFNLRAGRDYAWDFSGSSVASLQAIKERRVAAAAVAVSALADAAVDGSLTSADYRVIYQSDRFPTTAVGHAHDLKPSLAKTIREALMSFDWKQTSLEPFLGRDHTRFVPVDYRSDWRMIRRIDEVTGTMHRLPIN